MLSINTFSQENKTNSLRRDTSFQTNRNEYIQQLNDSLNLKDSIEKETIETKIESSTPTNKIYRDKKGVEWYNGNRIYTGPRGGKYYMNSKGKKTYVQ